MVQKVNSLGPRYYDKYGKKITLFKAGRLSASPDYARIAETTINDVWVSTVWLGLDHNLFRGSGLDNESEQVFKKHIFETMVFRIEDRANLEMKRYSTLKEAKLGHKRIVKKWQQGE